MQRSCCFIHLCKESRREQQLFLPEELLVRGCFSLQPEERIIPELADEGLSRTCHKWAARVHVFFYLTRSGNWKQMTVGNTRDTDALHLLHGERSDGAACINSSKEAVSWITADLDSDCSFFRVHQSLTW